MNKLTMIKLFGDTFEIQESLGGGTHAAIFSAKAKKKIDTQTPISKEQIIALKAPLSENASGIYRINNEIKIFEAIGSNENIIKYYGWLKQGKVPIILLEKSESDLSNWINDFYRDPNAILSEGLADTMIERMTKGFQAVHNVTGSNGEKYLHRDISTSNVLIFGTGMEGIAKVGDFGSGGVAKPKKSIERPDVGITSISSGTFHGKIIFSAPEIIFINDNNNRRKEYSIQTEVCSLSNVIWPLLCGQTPYEKDGIEEDIFKIKAAKQSEDYFNEKAKEMLVPKGVTHNKIETIKSGLNPDPRKRPNSFNEFLDEYFKGEASNVLENNYQKLEQLLNQPTNGLYRTMTIENVDAAINIYEKMVAYEKQHNTTSSFTQQANDLLVARAKKDYKALIEKTTEVRDNLLKGKKEFKTENEKHEFITNVGKKAHVWGNNFGAQFIDSKFKTRVSPKNETELENRIKDYYR